MRAPIRALVVTTFSLLTALQAFAEGAPKGHLVLVGGGDKPPEAMRKFIALAGGLAAPIVAIPTASNEPDAPDYYRTLFRDEYACTQVAVLDIKTREDAARQDYAELALRAGGIFFGGGDQSRITRAILDTPVGRATAEAFARGAVIGGTSAGTACQSPLMITGEGDFTVVADGAVELVPGFGFFRGVIVDQHFLARQRFNRLLSVILAHPELLGVGVDEDTAVWVRPDGTFQVLGSRSVVVIDARGAAVTRARREGGHNGLGAHGLLVSVLVPGEEFDTGSREVMRPTTPAPPAS